MEKGKKNWVFCDGYLPPHGDNPEFEGHEALMLTNLNNEKANIELVFLFEDRDPEEGNFVNLFEDNALTLEGYVYNLTEETLREEKIEGLRLLNETTPI